MTGQKRANAKKDAQLGMSHGTARHRLLGDLLFSFAVQHGHRCFQCGGELTRETFSIEHKTPWLDSASPRELFFDLTNIAFSHYACNVRAARKPHKKYFSEEEKRAAKNAGQKRTWEALGKEGQKKLRHSKYKRWGK